MEKTTIILSAIWVALMLTYLLGDVMRILAGDQKAGQIGGKKVPQGMWLWFAILIVIPVFMVVLSLVLPYPANRWVNIGVAAFFFIFNLIGLPSYPASYSRFLVFVGLAFNLLTIWYAWNWI
jgi:hypothetical protein